ncbi:DUF4440 domain-containing protein [Kitasatospora sp. SUK 42]|uniref:YybH family protein n=1 Tax=Kitasatospora sp. SUK 42 TaxID=1588882 RepID=UPI0018CB7E48|nr:DUF4440 domain-containing protein [Kitasatospora sp. SUK 42]MBV2156627.1 DUF4440 domain-containing protein [Kitasatospora sp. SUK 42]
MLSAARVDLFDETIRLRDEAFHARDLEATMGFYREDALEIDPSGAFHRDKAAISAQIGMVFGLGLTARFVELARTVDLDHGTAVLVLDSTFESSPPGFRQHFLTAQTFTFDDGEWRLLLAANTMLAD